MSKKDEEDLFNKLMETPTGADQTPEEEFEKPVVEYNFTGSETGDDLNQKFGNTIKNQVNKIGNLEGYLKKGLGQNFDRIKGAWSQYKEGTIKKDDFLYCGLVVLRKDFVEVFLETAEPKVKAPVPEATPQIPESAPPPEVKPVVEKSPKIEAVPQAPQIKIPSILFDSLEEEPAPKKEGSIKIEKAPEVKSINIERLLDAKPVILKEKKFEKIEHTAPERKTRTRLDALAALGTSLEKVELEPMRYEKISQSEVKSVDVGSSLPGSPFFNEFSEVQDLLYSKNYRAAVRKLEDIKILAEKKDTCTYEKAEDMLININLYKMIPDLLEAGEKIIDEPKRALEKFKKALTFAKMLGDLHYIEEINKWRSRAREGISFLRMRKEAEIEVGDKLSELIRKNIKVLGKKESLMSIEEIKKYCAAKSDDVIIKVLVEMIQSKEVYAKFFPESKKVMFDKESNKLLGFKIG